MSMITKHEQAAGAGKHRPCGGQKDAGLTFKPDH